MDATTPSGAMELATAQNMSMSQQVDKLAAALAKAQGVMKPAAKDSSNPHFGNRYSSLAEVWDAIREPLTSNGLSVVQLPSSTVDAVTVATTLLHVSGQWMRSAVTMPLRPEYTKSGTPQAPGAQQVGSAITYGRRYGLCAMVGVASADDDDDGNAASKTHDAPSPAAQRGPSDADKAKALANMEAEGRVKRLPAEPVPVPSDQPAAKPSDSTAFNAPLYDACEKSGITCDELTADLRAKGILKGTMTIDNLGRSIVDALLDGKDKASGKRNWDLVVSRIKEARK